MSKTEGRRVLPFSVKVVAIVEDGKVNVELPAIIQTDDDEDVMIPNDIRIITVDPGANRSHNIMRDVRAELRKVDLFVSSKEQRKHITILN